MFKIFSTDICWINIKWGIQRVILRPSYIQDARFLKVNRLLSLFLLLLLLLYNIIIILHNCLLNCIVKNIYILQFKLKCSVYFVEYLAIPQNNQLCHEMPSIFTWNIQLFHKTTSYVMKCLAYLHGISSYSTKQLVMSRNAQHSYVNCVYQYF